MYHPGKLSFCKKFIIANEPFAKTLQIFETYVSLENDLCEKLVSSLEPPIKYDKRFKVTLVTFFPDFHFELGNLHLKCYIESFYINILLKRNKTTIH